MEQMTKKDGQTMDIVADNIEQLKTIFPEVFSEGKIDFERLQSLLGEYVNKDEEHYNFTWHGKKKAQMIAQTPSTGTLRPAKDESKNWDETQNLVIEGDNLEVLKLLQKSYHRKVKMIYIDPPYNTGKDFVYKDNFKDNIKNYQELTGQTDSEGKKLSTNTEANGRYHTDWLNMMYPRLKLARNLLTDDGVIFISIDENEQSNLKKLCDDIFGEENFVNCIIWKRKGGNTSPDKTRLEVSHDYILMYRKSSLFEMKFIFTKANSEDYIKSMFKYSDDAGLYRLSPLNAPSYRPTLVFDFHGYKPHPNGWSMTREKLEELYAQDKLVFPKKEGGRVNRKQYLHEWKGYSVNTVWTDISVIGAASSERTLFGTGQKPISLIRRMIEMSQCENGIVLDFFAGSGSTSHAVMDFNVEDGGKRRCISVQLPELTEEKSEAYKAGYKNIADITKERIRRAGAKIIEDNKNKEGIENLDTGFKVFKLDTSNIKTWDSSAENFDPENLQTNLLDAITNIKEDRKQEDVLYELLIKTGIDLSVPIETYNIADKTVYSMGLGSLIVCLDANVDNDTVIGITKLVEELKPESTKVIFKDDSFTDDVVKTNALQTLKRHNITDVQSL